MKSKEWVGREEQWGKLEPAPIGGLFNVRGTELRAVGLAANRSATSQDAAQKVAPHAPSMRERVWRCVWEERPSGVTRSDIAFRTSLKKDTANGRVAELVRFGYLYVSGQRCGESMLFVGDRQYGEQDYRRQVRCAKKREPLSGEEP